MLSAAGEAMAASGRAPVRLVETCRVATPPALGLADALVRLDRCNAPASAAFNGTIWRAYAAPASMHDQNIQVWRLLVDNHRVGRMDVWLMMRGGEVKHLTYDASAPDREWASGNYFSLPFFATAPIERVILRDDNTIGVSMARRPWVMPARDFAAHDRNLALAYGAGVGMLLLTILFHSSLFFAIRRRFQLIYCLHVGVLLVYGLCYSNIVRLIAPWLTADGVSRVLGCAMGLATATGIAFIVEFLGRELLPRRLAAWATVSFGGSIFAGLSYAVAPPALVPTVYYIGNIAALNTLVTTAVIVAIGCAKRRPGAAVLAAGWAMPIVVSLLYPLRAIGLVPSDWIPDGLMMAAATLECLILSLPVTARIRTLRVEHERAQERHSILERQAQTDALTGLANRRGFRDALDRAGAGLLPGAPLSVLVIDIDHFKRVNDRYGHGTGDMILQHVAGHVARMAGAGAIVARHGGEEFVVALAGHDLPRAGTIAERIRATVGESFDPDSTLPAVTVSIGVATGPFAAMDALLSEADRALYRAKEAGRDRVEVAGLGMAAAAA